MTAPASLPLTSAPTDPLDALLALLDGVRRSGSGWMARCPVHGDTNASLSVRAGDVVAVLAHCHGCRAGLREVEAALGLDLRCGEGGARVASDPTAREEAELRRMALEQGVDVEALRGRMGAAPIARTRRGDACDPPLAVELVRPIWHAATARMRDDALADVDREEWSYVASRGVVDASEVPGAFGILAPGLRFTADRPGTMPRDVASWPARGYRVVAPLFDHAGQLASLQARRIWSGEPKILSPRGVAKDGLLFAARDGAEVLRGGGPSVPILLGEGLIDHLTLCLASRWPVLSVPGCAGAAKSIGAWCRGRRVYLLLDQDRAGHEATREVDDAVRREGGDPRRVEWDPALGKDANDLLLALGGGRFARFLQEVCS